MRIGRPRPDSPWTTVGVVAVALLVGAIVPSPLPRRPEFDRVGPDKALHLLGHGAFAASLSDALRAQGADQLTAGVLAVGASTAYGVLLGTLQRWVPGRMPETADLVAGVVGSALGVVWWAHRWSAR